MASGDGSAALCRVGAFSWHDERALTRSDGSGLKASAASFSLGYQAQPVCRMQVEGDGWAGRQRRGTRSGWLCSRVVQDRTRTVAMSTSTSSAGTAPGTVRERRCRFLGSIFSRGARITSPEVVRRQE